MAVSDQTLLQLLKDNAVLDDAILDSAIAHAATEKMSLHDYLVKQDMLSDENIGKVLADHFQLPFVSLQRTAIPPQVLHLVPEHVARTQRVIVFAVSDKEAKVASSQPGEQATLQFLAQKLQRPLHVYFATDRDVEITIALYKDKLQSVFNSLIGQQLKNAQRASDAEAPVTQIVSTLIEYAYDSGASDIHIEPTDQDSRIRFRIDGILHDVLQVPKTLHTQIITRIKVESKLRTDEHLSAQDGKLQLQLRNEELDVRVSIVPIVDGEKCVMRLLTSHFRELGLTDLGMSEKDLEKVKAGFSKPYGMVVSTGPTGSGKTTTIYAILKILNTRERNIATIEDPVEYEIEGINQIQVNPKTNLTFAEGLRSILRQDPNIIYVGEVRDNETADIAINSAMTGHLVLSTLHTNDAATSLPRFIDMNIEPFLVASTVNTIIGQRLIRKLCEKCKYSYTLESATLEKYFAADQVSEYFGKEKELRLYKGKGCDVCHDTGYQGRIGLFEVLEMSEKIRELIHQKATADQILNQAIAEGMTTMLEDGLAKVQQGVTSLEEVVRETKAQ